jgi:putative spermidine/putrescine transport system substrate-binding protein
MISTCLANNSRSPPWKRRGSGLGGNTLRARHVIAAGAVIATSALMTAACGSSSSSTAASGTNTSSSSSSGSSSSSSNVNYATCDSATACGGMSALVAAAKKEGQLNVITLPSNWANYGTIMADFTKMYGIHITDANPEGSSAQELQAVKQLKGQSSAPDVVDVGPAFAVQGATEGLWAPYQVQTWSNIPAAAKDASGDYYADYGGYVAIGYNPSVVKVAPTTFKSLLTGSYKNQVAIDGSPTQTGSAFAAVYAAALANGGSLSNIAPGVSYFKSLKAAGNFNTVEGTPATVQSGETPILIWWDYLLNSEVKAVVKNLKIVIPSDGVYAGYYDQAISASAPDPAAARLWEEFLYSTQGQNLFLEGSTRPIELPSLVSAGTVNQAADAALPAVPGGGSTLELPTSAQNTAATSVVAQQWPSVSS